ncbi:MAG: acyloxyacyl hydrolase [Duncaniella sp.]|nr:acyloxyacyl hydrolase [Duncaniella sp.]
MKSELKRLINAAAVVVLGITAVKADDTIPSAFSRPVEWRIGAEVMPGGVLGTNSFIRGENREDKRIGTYLSGDIRADFSFNPATREGMLYRGLYQGVGLGVNSFSAPSLLGTPVSIYVYQGAPIVHFTNRLWLGYEWQFGAAFGWKHYDELTAKDNEAVSTSVTAHMGLGFKLHYSLSDRWQVSLGVAARHFSNGNTSWPNRGVNSLGASIGIAYVINPQEDNSRPADSTLAHEADRHGWMYDITAYGAWRKHIVNVGYSDEPEPELCPGRFGIVGLQFSPLYRLNRYVAVGPGLDMQWDEGAGLDSYWVEGSYGEDIMFKRPPFGKQLSMGLSAHAELTMPIFSVNAGLGYDFINPKGEKRFYQSLTLKTFVTDRLFLNVGYRLGSFKDPQNLMLGVGVRL